MKDRWPEMLEYQQKVQAMTDLERAYALVHSDPEHIEAAPAAARREGAEQASGEIRALRKALHEETMKRLASAAEMRERAAQTVLAGSRGGIRGEIADTIRALPLTPEGAS